jgi:hypothetical protein
MLVVFGLGVFGAVAATAAMPVLKDGVKITAGGKPIDAEIGHLVPCVLDWNGDGKKDLIVGQFQKGLIRLYFNEGADNAPVFKESSYLQAGGAQISLPAG